MYLFTSKKSKKSGRLNASRSSNNSNKSNTATLLDNLATNMATMFEAQRNASIEAYNNITTRLSSLEEQPRPSAPQVPVLPPTSNQHHHRNSSPIQMRARSPAINQHQEQIDVMSNDSSFIQPTMHRAPTSRIGDATRIAEIDRINRLIQPATTLQQPNSNFRQRSLTQEEIREGQIRQQRLLDQLNRVREQRQDSRLMTAGAGAPGGGDDDSSASDDDFHDAVFDPHHLNNSIGDQLRNQEHSLLNELQKMQRRHVASEKRHRDRHNTDTRQETSQGYTRATVDKKTLTNFHGKPDERFEDWVFEMQNYFKMSRLHPDDRLNFAIPYLKDDARASYRLSESEIKTFEDLVSTLNVTYAPINVQLELRLKLDKLKQTDGVLKYVQEFDKLMNRVDTMTEYDKIVMFMKGLNYKTRHSVNLMDTKTLNEVKKAAIKVDNYEMLNQNFRRDDPKRQTTQVTKNELNSSIAPGMCRKGCGSKWHHGHICEKKAAESPAKIDSQSTKSNLCYKGCGEIFKPGHKCDNNNQTNTTQNKSSNQFKPKNTANLITTNTESAQMIEVVNDSYREIAVNELHYSHQLYNTITLKSQALVKIVGLIHYNQAKCVLDTGATRSVMSKYFVDKHKLPISKFTTPVSLADGSVIQAVYTEPLRVVIATKFCRLSFLVTNITATHVLIGRDWFDATNTWINPKGNELIFPSEKISIHGMGYSWSNIESDEEINESDQLTENEYVRAVMHKRQIENRINEEDVLFTQETHEAQTLIDDELEEENTWDDNGKYTKIGVIDKAHVSNEQFCKIVDLINQNRNCFAANYKELGRCNIREIKINLTSNIPIFRHCYRMSQKEREQIRVEIAKMLEAGIIENSRSPYSASILCIHKKDGGIRPAVDYKPLNAITISDPFPMPRIEDILDSIGQSKFFTVLDCKSGFWQLQLEPGSRELTGFSTPEGHYHFNVLPFGLRNAPAEFSRIASQILAGLSTYALIYVDDTVVFSNTFEEHLQHVSTVLNRFKEANIKLNATKAVWFSSKIELLGHIISDKGICMDLKKIDAIKKSKYCKDVKAVQSFLGLCGYYRKFIANFSHIAKPLNHLIKKTTIWNFDEECKEAFDTLKQKLIEYPILRAPDFELEFILYTDASNWALGAVLAQRKGSEEYVVAYASKLLQAAEKNYPISEKECYAVVWAVKHFRTYLFGSYFKVVTDCSCLNWLMTLREPAGRLARWSIYLQTYQFKIFHRSGVSHTNADALSRPVLFIAQQLIESVKEQHEDDLQVLMMHALPTTQNEAFMLSHNEFFEDDGDITDNEVDEQYQFEVNESVLKSTESLYMNVQDEKKTK